jgi:hypothetical protein
MGSPDWPVNVQLLSVRASGGFQVLESKLLVLRGGRQKTERPNPHELACY